MTAADLSGRDLDVAVARALGCLEHYEHGCNARWMRYSTDPATLDEKLAWLNSHVWLGGVMLFEEPRRHPKLGRWIAIANECTGSVVERGARDDDARRFRVEGETLHEAVARLVVAVKEAMP